MLRKRKKFVPRHWQFQLREQRRNPRNHPIQSFMYINCVNNFCDSKISLEREIKEWWQRNFLKRIKKKKDLPLYVHQLNKEFQEQLLKGKKRKQKFSIKHQGYTYFAVLLIILLLIICINLLRKNYQQKQIHKNPVIAVKLITPF